MFSPLWVPGPARTFSFGEENVRCAHLFFSKGKCFLPGKPAQWRVRKTFSFGEEKVRVKQKKSEVAQLGQNIC